MKKTKSTIKHHKQASWVKFALVGLILSAIALVVAGLQYGVGPVAQMTGKSPTINKLTEVVASGNKTTVTVTQTQAQERRGTGTVTNTDTGTVVRHTDNVENPFSPIPKASSYCSSAKEKECSAKGQRCIISVTGGECQDIPGSNTQPPTTPTIPATGASCAGKWTSIGSGSWAQWGGTKNPLTGAETGSQVCIQCVDGVWKTSDWQSCDKVPEIPRPDQVIAHEPGIDLACFANGTWYSTGSNTGTQTCSKGHWCDSGQEWDGSACVKVQATNTTSSPQYQPSSCTPGCEGDNLRMCDSKGTRSYKYCPADTPGSHCDSASKSCLVTNALTSKEITDLSKECGSRMPVDSNHYYSWDKATNTCKSVLRTTVAAAAQTNASDAQKCTTQKPPTANMEYRYNAATKDCYLVDKGTSTRVQNATGRAGGTTVTNVKDCMYGGTDDGSKNTGKFVCYYPNGKTYEGLAPTNFGASAGQGASSPTLTQEQTNALSNPNATWSDSNPMRFTDKSKCPAGSKIKESAGGYNQVILYECFPPEKSNSNSNQATNNGGGSTLLVGESCSNSFLGNTCRFCPGGNFSIVSRGAGRTTLCGTQSEVENIVNRSASATNPIITQPSGTGTLTAGSMTDNADRCQYGGTKAQTSDTMYVCNFKDGTNPWHIGEPIETTPASVSEQHINPEQPISVARSSVEWGAGAASICTIGVLALAPVTLGTALIGLAGCGLLGVGVGGTAYSLQTTPSTQSPVQEIQYTINSENRGKDCTIGGENNCYDYCPSNGTNAVFSCDQGNKNCKCAK